MRLSIEEMFPTITLPSPVMLGDTWSSPGQVQTVLRWPHEHGWGKSRVRACDYGHRMERECPQGRPKMNKSGEELLSLNTLFGWACRKHQSTCSKTASGNRKKELSLWLKVGFELWRQVLFFSSETYCFSQQASSKRTGFTSLLNWWQMIYYFTDKILIHFYSSVHWTFKCLGIPAHSEGNWVIC